jgi:hypothetical protein
VTSPAVGRFAFPPAVFLGAFLLFQAQPLAGNGKWAHQRMPRGVSK